jgi:twitching motility protein PilT
MLTLAKMLEEVVYSGGSDLHLTTGTPPQIRVDGKLRPLGSAPLTAADTESLAYSIMTDAQKHAFDEKWELDFSFCIGELSRFRADVFRQRGAVACAFRAVPFEIKSFEDLGLPQVVEKLCDRPRGLILVTGPTGSGKSTTLAAMIDTINRDRYAHILTIEDPIEFLHTHKNCIVNQREVGCDTHSFPAALRAAVREDPDVVLIGEMRDPETVESALRIAETGHLTLATLHTNSAASTMNRIVNLFPAAQQTHIRTQLSMVLEAIICQALIPRSKGSGRCLAMEILIANSAIRNLIRENKIHQIYGMMQTGQEKYGMLTFNQSLARLAGKKQITLNAALSQSSSPEELRELIQRSAGMHLPDIPSRPAPPEPMPGFTR